jgi:galactose mutarotase-like enzyme
MTVLLLADDGIEVEMLPEIGGKITRLCDTARSREWLLPTEEGRRLPPPGSGFAESGMSGWDDMLPTIWPCSYPGEGSYAGRALPDHGELWTLSWEVLGEAQGEVTLSANLSSLPLRLERRAAVAPGRLRLDYQLTATGEEPLAVLWTAHPLFTCTPETRVVLPSSVTRVLDVIDPRDPHPVEWPGALDLSARLPPGTGRKLYLDPSEQISSASLRDATGAALTMSWDPAQVPYVGLWLDNGWFSDTPVAAIEPAIAFCDELALAVELGRAPMLAPRASLTWSLAVTFGEIA